MSTWTARYWKDLAERTVATGAETAIAVMTTTTFVARDGVSWSELGVTAGVAMLLAALKSLAGRNVGNPESASLIH